MEMECILVLAAHTEHRISVTGCFMSNIYTRGDESNGSLIVWRGLGPEFSTVAFRLIAARPNCSSIADFGAT